MGIKTSHVHEQKSLTSSQVATLQIPAYGKIHSTQLLFLTAAGAAVTEAQIRAEIAQIRLTIGGKDVINSTPVRILDAYESLGVRVGVNTAIGGIVELNFGPLV